MISFARLRRTQLK